MVERSTEQDHSSLELSPSFTESIFASKLKASAMNNDASRVAAAVPSGVGFLGAALIYKCTVSTGEQEVHQVHGLTTAASL